MTGSNWLAALEPNIPLLHPIRINNQDIAFLQSCPIFTGNKTHDDKFARNNHGDSNIPLHASNDRPSANRRPNSCPFLSSAVLSANYIHQTDISSVHHNRSDTTPSRFTQPTSQPSPAHDRRTLIGLNKCNNPFRSRTARFAPRLKMSSALRAKIHPSQSPRISHKPKG